jgi:hypothetical protein
MIDREVNVVQRCGRHFLGVKDFLDTLQINEGLSGHWFAPETVEFKRWLL